MLGRILIGAVGAAGAAVIGAPAVAADDPPPVPDINAFEPAKPSEFAVMNNTLYAFAAPGGLTCVLQRTGGYGCSGPLPGAPDGANLVSGGFGAPGFGNTDVSMIAGVGDVKPLPAHTRISHQTVSCGTDGVMTSCVNSRDQSGFVVSPAGSYLLGSNPLLDRPAGTTPF